MANLTNRARNAWSAFWGRDPTVIRRYSYSGDRPDRIPLNNWNIRTIMNTVYNRISVDVSMIDIHHCRVNENDQFLNEIDSGLNKCLTRGSANIDQSGRELIRELVMTMFDKGVVAVVPVYTDTDPLTTDAYQILELRIGTISEWYPREVLVKTFHEETGRYEEVVLPKRIVSIIENPFYSIMNEPNSTGQRLLRVLTQLDRTNEFNSSDKMNMIIQFPYAVKQERQRDMANQRRDDIEDQLTRNKYGIAWIDGTEKVIQLNRVLENNLWEQAQTLTSELFNQVGLSMNVFNGTASEEETLNYNNNILYPIMTAIVEEFERKWISPTARTQKQAIKYFTNPFKFTTTENLVNMAETMTRNEILTSNEVRSIIGIKPSDDPNADMLLNSNLNHTDDEKERPATSGEGAEGDEFE